MHILAKVLARKGAGNENFDIVAKAAVEGPAATDAPTAPGSQQRQRVQSLLAERFKLSAHRETRPLQLYSLGLARADGRLGSQLKLSAIDCQAMRGRGAGRGAAAPLAPGERPPCGMAMRPGGITAGATTMSEFIRALSMFTRRTVLDRTNLHGAFDIDLAWTPDQMPGPAPAGAPPMPAIDPNGPSIFTALQEQLGLKLESQTGPVDVLVVDHVEHPTPD